MISTSPNVSNVVCKYCQSLNVIKWGKVNGIPRYWCKSCKRKFADNGVKYNRCSLLGTLDLRSWYRR